MADYSRYWEDLLNEDYRLVAEGKYGADSTFAVHYGDIIEDGRFLINPKWKGLVPTDDESFVLINQQNTVSIKGNVYRHETKIKEGIYRIIDPLKDTNNANLGNYPQNTENHYTKDNIFDVKYQDVYSRPHPLAIAINKDKPALAQGIVTQHLPHRDFIWRCMPLDNQITLNVRADGTYYTEGNGKIGRVSHILGYPIEVSGSSNWANSSGSIFNVRYRPNKTDDKLYLVSDRVKGTLRNKALDELLNITFDANTGITSYILKTEIMELWNSVDFDIRDYDIIPISAVAANYIEFDPVRKTLKLVGTVINHEGFIYRPGTYDMVQMKNNPDQFLKDKRYRYFLSNGREMKRQNNINDIVWQWGNGHQNFRYVPYVVGQIPGGHNNATYENKAGNINRFFANGPMALPQIWVHLDDENLKSTNQIVERSTRMWYRNPKAREALEPLNSNYLPYSTRTKAFSPLKYEHMAMGWTMGMNPELFQHKFFKQTQSNGQIDYFPAQYDQFFKIDFSVFPWKIGDARELGFQMPYWNHQFYDVGDYVRYNMIASRHLGVAQPVEFIFHLESSKWIDTVGNYEDRLDIPRIRNVFTLDKYVHPLYQYSLYELEPQAGEGRYLPMLARIADREENANVTNKTDSVFEGSYLAPFYGHPEAEQHEGPPVAILPIGDSTYQVEMRREGEKRIMRFVLNENGKYLFRRRVISGAEFKYLDVSFSYTFVKPNVTNLSYYVSFHNEIGQYRFKNKVDMSSVHLWEMKLYKRVGEEVVNNFGRLPTFTTGEISTYVDYAPFSAMFKPGVDYRGDLDFGLPYIEDNLMVKYLYLNNMDEDIFIAWSQQDGGYQLTYDHMKHAEVNLPQDVALLSYYNGGLLNAQLRMDNLTVGQSFRFSMTDLHAFTQQINQSFSAGQPFTSARHPSVVLQYQAQLMTLEENVPQMIEQVKSMFQSWGIKIHKDKWTYVVGKAPFDNSDYGLYCDRFQGSNYISGWMRYEPNHVYDMKIVFAQYRTTPYVMRDWLKLHHESHENKVQVFNRLTNEPQNYRMGYIHWTGYPQTSYVVQPWDGETNAHVSENLLKKMMGEGKYGCFPIRDAFGNVVINRKKLSELVLPAALKIDMKNPNSRAFMAVKGSEAGYRNSSYEGFPPIGRFTPTYLKIFKEQPSAKDYVEIPNANEQYGTTAYNEEKRKWNTPHPLWYNKLWNYSPDITEIEVKYVPIEHFTKATNFFRITADWLLDENRLQNWTSLKINEDDDHEKVILRDFGYTIVPGDWAGWTRQEDSNSGIFVTSFGELVFQEINYFDVSKMITFK